MSTISFHTFMFPFRWKINGHDDKPFSEQVNLDNIRYALSFNWERMSTPTVEEEKANEETPSHTEGEPA